MVKHYLVSIFRNIKSNILNYSLNIIGLAIAIISSVIILIYVIDEYEFDTHHNNFNRIYRVNTKIIDGDGVQNLATSDGLLAYTIKNEIPEVQEACRIQFIPNTTTKINNKTFKESKFYLASPGIFNIFDYSFISGNSRHCLSEPNSIVITKSIAIKYFGSTDALNKEIIVNDEKFNISGIIRDLPKNSSLYFNALISNTTNEDEGWLDDFEYYTFVLLNENSSSESIDDKLKAIVQKNVNPILESYQLETKIVFYTEPLKEIHFGTDKLGDFQKGNKKMVDFFLAIAIFMLMIACFNYINISLSLINKKRDVLRIKKIHGCKNTQLFCQYLIEPSIIVLISAIIAILGIIFFGIQFNSFLDKSIFTNFYKEQNILLVIIGIIVFLILMIGLYPSYYVSLIKICNKAEEKRKKFFFSKTILVFQLAISLIVIIFTIVNYQQLNFMRNTNLGLNTENVLVVEIPKNYDAIKGKVRKIRNELLKIPSIKAVSISGVGSELFTDDITYQISDINIEGVSDQLKMNVIEVDDEYLDLMNIKLSNGNGFIKKMPKSNQNSVIINKALLNKLKLKDPIGKQFIEESKIIGVVNDFHYKSLHNIIEPLVFTFSNNDYSNLLVKMSSKKDLDIVKRTWKNNLNDYPMFYSFEEDHYNNIYAKDKKVYSILLLSVFILIVISCLGIFNLSSLSLKQKTKSIAIRYIFGAERIEVISLLVKDYIVLVLTSALIGCPIVFYLIKKWLETFPYQINITAVPFITAFIFMLFISLATILFHVIKASYTSPILNLKDE